MVLCDVQNYIYIHSPCNATIQNTDQEMLNSHKNRIEYVK